jgi:RNA polymerase sigma factor (sigma-70 family)
MGAVETDEALLVACQEGGREAFAGLVERYKDLVCALTFSATGDRALSEDLAQETFLVAWRGLPTLREAGKFRAWLCGIARNLSRNARRDGAREVSTADVPEVAVDAVVIDALAADEEEALVWRALADMPESYREPLVLFYREGKSAAEVAAALGLSVNATEQRISRGRKQLKDSVATLVERTLERTRPGSGFVAAVIASIGTQLIPTSASAAPATASASKTTASMGAAIMAFAWKGLLAGMAATAVTYGCITWNESGDHTAEDTTVGPVIDAPRPQAAGPRPTQEVRDLLDRREHDADETEAGEAPLPRYQLTVISENSAAIELTGGLSEVTTHPQHPKAPGDPPDPIVRTISGRVLDRDGVPRSGVVVITGKILSARFGNLMGQRGATTTVDGRFEIGVTHPDAIAVLALHETGWSELVQLPAGDVDARLELRLHGPARFEGSLRRADAPVISQLHLGSARTGLVMGVESDERGHVVIEAVPPGHHEVAIGLAGGGGSDARLSRTLELVAGRTVTWDADLDAGSTVVVDTHLPADSTHQTIEYTMVPGRPPQSAAELKERFEALTGAERRRMLFGGIDLDNVMEFRDVPRGKASVCVQLQERRDVVLAFGCSQIDVRAGNDVQEVDVTPVLVAP